jgi:hypothetical protein
MRPRRCPQTDAAGDRTAHAVPMPGAAARVPGFLAVPIVGLWQPSQTRRPADISVVR